MLKKYLYAGILLGTVVLAGCNVNNETERQVKEEIKKDLADGQVVEVEAVSDTVKGEKMSVTPLDLTQEQKENYYKEYVAIIKKANSEYGANLEIKPINEFHDEYWIEVKDFEKMAKDRANAKIIVSKNTDVYAPDLVPKTAEFQIGSRVRTISFSGSFETQLNSNTADGRQLFSGMNSISSQVEGDGIWEQTGYDYSIINNGRSYRITVGGKYSDSGISSSHLIDVEFNCNENGGIS